MRSKPRPRGQSLVEYSVVLGLFSVAAIAALIALKRTLDSIWSDLSFWLSLPSP